MAQLTEEDRGKKVITADGETVGMVSRVEHGRAFVDPDAGITDQVKAKLGWEDTDESSYTVEDDQIDTVTDDEIRLSR